MPFSTAFHQSELPLVMKISRGPNCLSTPAALAVGRPAAGSVPLVAAAGRDEGHDKARARQRIGPLFCIDTVGSPRLSYRI